MADIMRKILSNLRRFNPFAVKRKSKLYHDRVTELLSKIEAKEAQSSESTADEIRNILVKMYHDSHERDNSVQEIREKIETLNLQLKKLLLSVESGLDYHRYLNTVSIINSNLEEVHRDVTGLKHKFTRFESTEGAPFSSSPLVPPAFTAELGKVSHTLETMRDFLLLKEIAPGSISAIAQLPTFRKDAVDDLFGVFSARNGSAKTIRGWCASLIAQIATANYKSLSRSEKSDFLYSNISRVQRTNRGQEIATLCHWIDSSAKDSVFGESPSILLPYYQKLETYGKHSWVPRHKRTWLGYVGILQELGELDTAKVLLKRIYDSWGSDQFDRFLPIAYLANSVGISDEKIAKSARIWEAIANPSTSFHDFLSGKTIALVGNGPQEKGLGRGIEIDSHDIVIRMNNATINLVGDSIKDYGEKTTILGGHLYMMEDVDFEAIPAFFHRGALHRQSVGDRDYIVMEKLVAMGKPIYHNDSEQHGIIARFMTSLPDEPQFKFHMLSTGFFLALLAKGISNKFTWDDLYGYSVKDEEFAAEYIYTAAVMRNYDKYRHFSGHEIDLRFTFNNLGREGATLRYLFGKPWKL